MARSLFFPTLMWNILLGRLLNVREWWSRIDDTLYLGALPFPSDVPRLAGLGVKGVINTCEEYRGPVRAYRSHSIDQLRIPVVDYCSPTREQLQESLHYIERHRAQGSMVYVHCKAGRGRSATVALCWLVKSQGMTPSDAMKELIKRRRHVSRNIHRRQAVLEVAGSVPAAR